MNYCEHPQWESTDLLWGGQKVHRCRSCQVLFTLNGRVRSVKRRDECQPASEGATNG